MFEDGSTMAQVYDNLKRGKMGWKGVEQMRDEARIAIFALYSPKDWVEMAHHSNDLSFVTQ